MSGKMELAPFLDYRLKPVSEELAASGARHVMICSVPASGRMRVYSDMAPPEKAYEMRRIAEALLSQAEQLERGTPGDASAVLPGLPSGIIKPS